MELEGGEMGEESCRARSRKKNRMEKEMLAGENLT